MSETRYEPGKCTWLHLSCRKRKQATPVSMKDKIMNENSNRNKQLKIDTELLKRGKFLIKNSNLTEITVILISGAAVGSFLGPNNR